MPLIKNRRSNSLRDETGSALVDSMVGVFILSVAIGAVVFAVTSISTATGRVADAAGQEMVMRSTLATLINYPAGVPTTPETSDVVTEARTVTVTRVRVDLGDDRSIIRAISGKSSSADCSGVDAIQPTPADYDRCLIYEREVHAESAPAFNLAGAAVTAVTATQPLATPIAVQMVADGKGSGTLAGTKLQVWEKKPTKIGDFYQYRPVNFVVKIGPSTAPGQILFMDGKTPLAVIEYDRSTSGYFYGTLTPEETKNGKEKKVKIEIEHRGAAVKVSQLFIYEVTR